VVVHGLGHQRIALRPVIAALGDEPDAHGIAAGHQPEAVVLDLVNPIGAGRGLVGWGWEAGFDETRPVGGKPLSATRLERAPPTRAIERLPRDPIAHIPSIDRWRPWSRGSPAHR
jgi:hypothetical protein